MTTVFVILTLLTTWQGPSPTPAAELPFEFALLAAEKNRESPEGRRYNNDLNRSAAGHLPSVLERCLGGPVSGQLSFQVLLQIGENGKVVTAMVKPETRAAACVRDTLKHRRFPKPPTDGHWGLVNLQLK
jgi:hypothetical protein